MHWTIYIILANISVAFTEYIYRKGSYENFFVALPVIFPLMLVSQYSLFEGFKNAPSLLLAGAVFSLLNIALRVVNCAYLQENLNFVNWCGVAFMVGSVILLRVKS